MNVPLDKVSQHIGHNIEIVTYGNPPVNVAIECEDCWVVIADCDTAKEVK